MSKYDDTVGKIYGKNEVLSIMHDGHRYLAKVKCIECGRIKTMYASELTNPINNSCRCQTIKHAGVKSRLYGIWGNMKYRCNNPNAQEYYNYGGKGIKVCDEWNDFIPFRDWAIANGYTDELTIDRIDSNQGYNPSNCRWVTKRENTIAGNKSGRHRRANRGTYYGYSPDKMEFYVFTNANKFAAAHNLNAGCVRACAAGEKKTHYGWTFGYLKDLAPKPQSTIENTK